MGSFIGQKLREYEIQQQIGEGGSSIVYKAYQSALDRFVAVKAILAERTKDPDFSERFNEEARLIAHLEHRNIVPIYDYWHDDQGAFLVMRWMRGGTLRNLLYQQGALPLAQVTRVIDQLAEALTVAHDADVIHCDLKPGNVLLDERSNAYLTDFGIARHLGTDHLSSTTNDLFVGTAAYLAPEQILNRPLGPQADIYSLGLILFEMLAGKHPYHEIEAPDFSALLKAHQETPLPPLLTLRPDLPPQVEHVIQKAAAKDPLERYSDVGELAAELRDLTAGHTSSAPAPGSPMPPRTRTTAKQRDRQFMLQNVRSFWIQGLLNQSLHNSVLIELELQETASARPWDTEVQSPSKTIPSGANILDVYDKLNGKLLVLGDPGSGKTTTLLELARHLLGRAESDDQHPIPVIFNLSSWSATLKPIDEWVVDELSSKYQTARGIALDWVGGDELLLLLDGLDEVAPQHREACVQALNEFREQHGYVDIVVCSRTADYDVLLNRLKLNGAIVVQNLSDAQIDKYLRRLGPSTLELRQLLHSDKNLRELTRSPFMLSILVLTYSGKTLIKVSHMESSDALRRIIFETYVRRTVERRRETAVQTWEESAHYLSWLAYQMQKHGQSLFQVEGLQSSWLTAAQRERYYRLVLVVLVLSMTVLLGGWRIIDSFIQGVPLPLYGSLALLGGAVWGWMLGGNWFKRLPLFLIPGILLGLGWGSAVAMRDGLEAGIRSGLISACVNSGTLGTIAVLLPRTRNDRDHIVPIQKMRFSLNHINVLAVLASLLTAIVYYWPTDLSLVSVVSRLLSCLMITLIVFFASGMVPDKVERSVYPNQGIRRSFAYGLRAGVLFCLATFISVSLQGVAMPLQLAQKTADGITSAIMIGNGAFLGFGWYPVLHHVCLRYVLRKDNMIPQNYAAFLDYATRIILLRKVGGGYIFIHRYLLEYFASLYDDSAAKQS